MQSKVSKRNSLLATLHLGQQTLGARHWQTFGTVLRGQRVNG
jgi:hypothetical protein